MEFLTAGNLLWVGGALVGTFVVAMAIILVMLRRVVPTNMVHIVQTTSRTTSYGRGEGRAGNTYYAWPSWVPKIGITVITFPESIFPVQLEDYEAYDQARLPFMVDVTAFFRISNSETAAQRVASFGELEKQLHAVLKGAVRRILATNVLEEIMQQRSELGEKFTQEVDHQIAEWGVKTVKTIEFMDIRDSKSAGSKVIANIMAKEQSRIDKESRVAVASNNQSASIAEIEAARNVELQEQEAQQQVGMRTADKDKAVGIAREKSNQEVQEQAKTTAEKQMAVLLVQETRAAEIAKAVAVTNAEAEKQTVTLKAEGDLAATQRKAEGIKVEGEAVADAETKRLMAPVTAQIELAREIGENDGYQSYLINLEQVKAGVEVGLSMADAIKAAKVQIISTGGGQGEIIGGVAGIGDLFSPKGGVALSSMLTAFAKTPEGEKVLNKFLGTSAEATDAPTPNEVVANRSNKHK